MTRKRTPTTIVRAPKDRENPYRLVRQATFEDRRLTWEARGVIAYLLVKPDDWEISVTDLWRAGDVGRDKIYRILTHLEDNGYLVREEIRTHGKFVGVRYLLYEEPLPKNQEMESDQPFPEIQETATRVEPFPEKPYPVNQEHTNNEVVTNNETEQQLTEEKDDDEAAYAAVYKAWTENVPQELTPLLEADLRMLVSECGASSVLRGIATGVRRGSANFLYIAECARNDALGIKPPAKRKSVTRSKAKPKQNEPGDYTYPLPELPPAPDPLPEPEPLTGLAATWSTCRQELKPMFNGAGGWLTGSQLTATQESRDGKPVYRLYVTDARSVDWLQRMASRAICHALGGLLKEQIVLDILAIEPLPIIRRRGEPTYTGDNT